MPRRTRRKFSAQESAAILKQQLPEGQSVFERADEPPARAEQRRLAELEASRRSGMRQMPPARGSSHGNGLRATAFSPVAPTHRITYSCERSRYASIQSRVLMPTIAAKSLTDRPQAGPSRERATSPGALVTEERAADSAEFVDNRPAAVAQGQLQHSIDRSPRQVGQRRALGSAFGSLFQRQETLEEEELLQARFDPLQRQAPEGDLRDGQFDASGPDAGKAKFANAEDFTVGRDPQSRVLQRYPIDMGEWWESSLPELGDYYISEEEVLEAEARFWEERAAAARPVMPEEAVAETPPTPTEPEEEPLWITRVRALERVDERDLQGVRKIWELGDEAQKQRILDVMEAGGEELKRLGSLEYFLEAINPIHLGYDKGLAIFRTWTTGVLDYGIAKSYADWVVEKQDTSEGGQKRLIEYYDEEAREEYKLSMSGQRVLKADREPLQGDSIYALSPDEEFYGGSKDGPVHHSSFLAGTPVICAGHLYTEASGKLNAIDNTSGHYAPTEANLKNAARVLMKKMDTSEVYVRGYSRTGAPTPLDVFVGD